MINLEKLDAAIAHIEANPEEWNQAQWFSRGDGGCGTAACLAGTIAVLDGWRPTEWADLNDGGEISGRAEKDGVVDSVDDIAMNALGAERSAFEDAEFTGDEQWLNEMFLPDNDIVRIRYIRDEIAVAQVKAVAG